MSRPVSADPAIRDPERGPIAKGLFLDEPFKPIRVRDLKMTFRRYRGFNPKSKTLIGPTPKAGRCLGPHRSGGFLSWVDPAVKWQPGDVVDVRIWNSPDRAGDYTLLSKQVEIIGGRPWFVSLDGVFPFQDPGMQVIGVEVLSLSMPNEWHEAEQPVMDEEKRLDLLHAGRSGLKALLARGGVS